MIKRLLLHVLTILVGTALGFLIAYFTCNFFFPLPDYGKHYGFHHGLHHILHHPIK